MDLEQFIPKVRFEMIPIRNLVSNQDYQRKISVGHVKNAVDNFDIRQVNPVKVSRRDGINFVFDGQHTIEIIATVSQSRDTPVWCMIYDELEYTEEATIFAEQQKYVKRLSPYEIFIARIEAGDPDALLIRDLVHSYGLELSHSTGLGKLVAVAALESVYTKYGLHLLDRTLRLLLGAWQGEPDSLAGNYIRAVALLIDAFGDDLEENRFKEKLGNTSLKYINRNAKEYNRGASGYAFIILECYNQKLQHPLNSNLLFKAK